MGNANVKNESSFQLFVAVEMHSTYLINLARRADRLEKFHSHHSSRILYQRVEAVDDKNAPRRGCRLSHLKCLKLAKASQVDYVIILEDDTVLRTDEKEIVSAIEAVKHEWEMLLLSVSNGAHLLYTNLGGVGNGRTLFAVNHYFMGTYAMVVHKKAFDRLIEAIETSTEDPDMDIDLGVYNKVCEGKIFLTVPFMADVLKNDQSDIRAGHDTRDDHANVLWMETVLKINHDL